MKLRFYAALVTGALAEVLTTFGLWCGTKMQLEDILFWSITAYFVGMAVTMAVTEPKKKKPVQLGEPTIITLDREEWENV